MTEFYGIQTGTIPGFAELLSAVLAHQATRRML